jgi:hypothetical protein
VLTVVCWKWDGWRAGYTAEQVNVLERMLKEHLHLDHRLVCVTDDPTGVRCETMEIWNYPVVETLQGRPNCFRRLRLFSDEAGDMFGPRVLSIDLDCAIMGDITPLITDHDFRILQGEVAPYNGSMWLLRTGARPRAWDEFDPDTFHQAIAKTRTARHRPYYGSDQAWLSYVLPGEATWSEADGVYQYRNLALRSADVPNDARIVFFAGSRKPWDHALKRQMPIIYKTYRKYRDQL